MNFKIKLLLTSFMIFGFGKSSCMQVLKKGASSAVAGAAARNLVFEDLPGFFSKEDKSEKTGKKNLSKLAHGSSAIINCLNVLLSSELIFQKNNMNPRAQWGLRWLYLVPAFIGSSLEREVVKSLKDIKMLKKHEEVVNLSMPALLLALQYIITRDNSGPGVVLQN